MAPHREIGGYLELERFSGEPYHKGAIALNCGRSCLEYLIELRGISTIWLPDWLCQSIRSVCEKCKVRIFSYKIGEDMRPSYEFDIGSEDYLYLVDYYGQLNSDDVEFASRRCRGHLIVDESQGFFRPPWKNADTLYTCRKFFGVADGGYLYTRDGARLTRDLPRGESHAHMGFVLGRFERPAGEFFADSKKNNRRFVAEGLCTMSPITENIMRAVDYEAARNRRNSNYAYLSRQLNAVNRLSPTKPNGPFMYPLLTKSAPDIRALLAKAGVFIPKLWPNTFIDSASDTVAQRYSEYILPLPIDQRYGIDDMARMVDSLQNSSLL